jgi:hypothetical protein
MADYDSGLPIRSEADGTDERLHSKIVDFSDPGGTDKQVQVSEKLLHNRNFGQDPAGVKRAEKLSETGETAVDGTYHATDNTNPANIGIVVQERNATSSDVRQTMKPTATRGSVDTTKVAIDIALNDESGNAFTKNNPLPVSIEESEGDEVCDRKTSSSVAVDTTVNHDYTVTALKTLIIDGAWFSASGKVKAVLSVETGVGTGVFTPKFDAFNSTSTPNQDIPIRKRLKVAAGVRVRIAITNRDNQPQDVYSTLTGDEK